MHIIPNANGDRPYNLDASDLARIETELESDILVMSLLHDLTIALEAAEKNEWAVSKVADLEEDLEEVRQELEAERQELKETKARLQRVRSELGALRANLWDCLSNIERDVSGES
jgi:hypothetical protein